MAALYIHIPFCKQACIYCDFHFSTSLKKKGELVEALRGELQMRKNEPTEKIETIYFGGGTPSLLDKDELKSIFKTVYQNYDVVAHPEITLEANPDDLSEDKIRQLSGSKVNRLSIGVQSFFEDDLKWMNRSHNAEQAWAALKTAKTYFNNISMDLIYGVPGMDDAKWKENLEKTLELGIPHVSAYALTVESQTVLGKLIERGKMGPLDEAAAKSHYDILVKTMEEAGYVNYEFSNYGRPGYFSQNNTAYWFGKPYLGIGPSAHGFDGKKRMWNVKNNTLYSKAIERGELPQETENLTTKDRYNEYIMTRLRTQWGISLPEIQDKFGDKFSRHLEKEAAHLFEENLLTQSNAHIHISKQGKFLGDGISAELFYVE